MTTTTEQLTQVIDEVIVLNDCRDDDLASAQAMDGRLQQVMMGRHALECLELALCLRATSSRRHLLPTWQPLLNATVELIQQRGESQQLLCGMLPPASDPPRNTGQPVYKPHQT
jgi:tRNA-dihydrouridine synthase